MTTPFRLFCAYLKKRTGSTIEDVARDLFVSQYTVKAWGANGFKVGRLTTEDIFNQYFKDSVPMMEDFLIYLRQNGYCLPEGSLHASPVDPEVFKLFFSGFLTSELSQYQQAPDAARETNFAFTKLLSAILHATFPDRRGANDAEKSVLLTRYALFSLIKKDFPEEEALLRILSDGTASALELTEACAGVRTASPELSALFADLVFVPHYSEGGKPSGMIVIDPRSLSLDVPDEEQYEKALHALKDAYSALPTEFHSNVRSVLKKEINTTVSQLTLAAAYRGLFSVSEQSRAELLDLTNLLVKSHNHHNSYLYALVERHRDQKAFLFKEYDPDDYECKRAVGIIKEFFYDNFMTEQSASYVGKKLLLWCTDPNTISDLIEHHCYDQKIWRAFAEQYGGAATLRAITRRRIYQRRDFRTEEDLRHVLSFLQMITMEDLHFLIYHANDEQYNKDVRAFVKALIENVTAFPKARRAMLEHGIGRLLIGCSGYCPDGDLSVTKQILAELDVDLSSEPYAWLAKFKEQLGAAPYLFYSPDAVLTAFRDAKDAFRLNPSDETRRNAAKHLRMLLLNRSVPIDTETRDAIEALLSALLDGDTAALHAVILSTAYRTELFSDETTERIVSYVRAFLLNCDYAQQKHGTVKSALLILRHGGYADAEDALLRCYASLREIKKCKPAELLSLILEGLPAAAIVRRLNSEQYAWEAPVTDATKWLLTNSFAKKALADALSDDRLFEFVDLLIDECKAHALREELSLSVLHFVKRQDCFADKAPTSDEFYSAILRDAGDVAIDSRWLERKAREHGLSQNTALFHLCSVLMDDPRATAYVSIERLAKFYGTLSFLYQNPQNDSLKDTLLFQRRMKIFSLLISNPAIRSTAKFYCLRMRKYARLLPPVMIRLITDAVGNDRFPAWLSDAQVAPCDRLATEAVWLSELKHAGSALPATPALTHEIRERLIPFLETADLKEDVYSPDAVLLAVKKSDGYYVVDGNRAVSHFERESVAFGDFRINVCTVTL